MTKLERGQVAVVTGAASGIGEALVQAFAARGLVIVAADVDEGGLDRIHGMLTDAGARAKAVVTDVARADDVGRLAEATLATFGRVDVVCNNAGVAAEPGPCWETALPTYQKVLSVNLWGVIHGVVSFVPHLVEQNHGHILNTASMAGLRPNANTAVYAMSKHAVVAMTKALSAELASAAPGVGVTALCPGLVRTPLGEDLATRYIQLAGGTESVAAEAEELMNTMGALDAADVAASALAAIEAGYLYAVPTPGSLASITEDYQRLLAEAAAQEDRPMG